MNKTLHIIAMLKNLMSLHKVYFNHNRPFDYPSVKEVMPVRQDWVTINIIIIFRNLPF